MTLRLYNTLTRRKERFEPIDPRNVRVYVCGPTVYDYAHIGNARPVIVFDVLFRLLRHLYGPDHVAYVRNITDVDDKINARAKEENRAIEEITAETTKAFHEDAAALGCLEPSVEPRATAHIAEMIAMIERLVANGCAYEADGHVLFHVPAMPDYGRLARRSPDEMLAGARVEVAPYKKDPMDFVLWKPSESGLPGWDSPWGRGRPGWHIECSAMAAAHLGETFDIHGGGIDLVFPHHENEIAQSRCCFGTKRMAKVWMHNGYLQVEGEKMSKSLGNFVTVHDLLETENFGGHDWPGSALRLAMLTTHYRQPLDWTLRGLETAWHVLNDFFRVAAKTDLTSPSAAVLEALGDDLNTPLAIAALHDIRKRIRQAGQGDAAQELGQNLNFLGLDWSNFVAWCDREKKRVSTKVGNIAELIAARDAARKAKDFAAADRIRDELAEMGIELHDTPEGTTWEIAR